MKKLAAILSLMFLLTACNSSPNHNPHVEDAYENIMKEYTSPEGYRITEYENGHTTILSSENNTDIVKVPAIWDMTKLFDYKLEELPKEEGEQFFHDLRSRDLTKLDLSNELDYLLTADFDDHTIWPDSLPIEYDIEKIKEYGMDPGLGIRKLHEKGITGQGIGIAIIDQTLLVNHVEYKDQIKLYEEIHMNSNSAQMHGPAVASIAVGKNVGVAPKSDLYYITTSGQDLYWIAKSIDRIIEINKSLATESKIGVISLSRGILPTMENYELVEDAINRASNEGIYTITIENSLMGAGRKPLGNPNDLKSYKKGHGWRDIDLGMRRKTEVLVPMDSRCVASPTGQDKYVFYYSGGMSWAVPYTAGLYALCSQVNPNITPDEFNAAIYNTATKVKLDDTEYEYKILNPEELINKIKK